MRRWFELADRNRPRINRSGMLGSMCASIAALNKTGKAAERRSALALVRHPELAATVVSALGDGVA